MNADEILSTITPAWGRDTVSIVRFQHSAYPGTLEHLRERAFSALDREITEVGKAPAYYGSIVDVQIVVRLRGPEDA